MANSRTNSAPRSSTWWARRVRSRRCRSAPTTTSSEDADIIAAVDKVSDGSGVILLTDMFGGTPSNLAISVMEAGKVEVVAGVNLPMLIKIASVRADEPLTDVIAEAQEAGRKYINVASQVLNGK
jgi:PTS system mannose-specific IIA component